MGGFFGILFGVALFFFVIGLIRYYISNKTEVAFDLFDALVAAFYVLFSKSMNNGAYAICLFVFCIVIVVLSRRIKPLGKIFFEKKYYFWKKEQE